MFDEKTGILTGDDGKEYKISPLKLGFLRDGGIQKIKDHDESLVGDFWKAFNIRAEIIFDSMKQTNPDLTQEEFDKLLDVENSIPIWRKILGMSGLGDEGAPAEPNAPLATTSGQSMET